MSRYACIDVGTNSVLLLVAERRPDGRFAAVSERAEITRLGRGVDQTRRLAPESVGATVAVLEAYVAEARRLGAEGIAITATSAARDAENGAEFLARAEERTGVAVEIIGGDLEAQLSFAAVAADFRTRPPTPLVAIDIGGGSTELIYGGEGVRADEIAFRRSFDVGSVRLTERYVHEDPMSAAEQGAILEALAQTFQALPPPPPDARVVGVAGTVTTLYAIAHRIDPYDAERVQGGTLTSAEVRALAEQLCTTPLAERRKLPGLQPKRADVIPAGALILSAALARLNAEKVQVSDRGLRWGLLYHRFGSTGA